MYVQLAINYQKDHVFLIFNTTLNIKPKDQIIKKATAWKFLRSTLTRLCTYLLLIYRIEA